jgi:Heterokaryon incompatibility protein (HET)
MHLVGFAILLVLLSICEKYTQSDNIPRMPQVRFIEVNSKRVVTFNDVNLTTIRYAALSYVWGKPPGPDSEHYSKPVLQLDGSTATRLHQPNAFRGEDVPQTIVDLLSLATALEIPYLWIDRLCILQDSDEDKAAQLGILHTIYNAALVTVVAAAGEDIYHGLPGLRPGTRQVKQQEIVVVDPCASDCREDHYHNQEGLSLLSCLEPFFPGSNYLGSTTWNNRGWTMQERILARRSLIFTKEQVRFACTNATYSEETYCELPFPRMQAFSQIEADHGFRRSVRVYGESGDPETRLWGRFTSLVERFSIRSLTYSGDVYDAFAAITQALAIEAKDEFLWGVPISQFEIGLSWRTYDGQHRRKELTTLPMTDKHRRVKIPSWSWMGWVGQTSISVGRERTETEKPTIECYVHSHTDKGVEIIRIQYATPASRSWKPRFLHRPWRFHEKRAVSIRDVKEHLTGFDFQTLLDIPANHVLFFWTSWATLRVARPESGSEALALHEQNHGFFCTRCYTIEQHLSGAADPAPGYTTAPSNYAPNILDSDGKVVGSMSRMRPEYWEEGSYDSGIHEFIVVGRRYVEELAEFFPATLLIMQVERRGEICYRVNLGEISETDWDQAGGELKLIVLG